VRRPPQRGYGQLVTKDELWRAVWPRVSVTDAALTVCVSEIRKALGDDAKTPRYLETAQRLGYRFISSVSTEPVRVARSTRWGTNSHSAPHRASPTRHFVGRQEPSEHMLKVADAVPYAVFTGRNAAKLHAQLNGYVKVMARSGKEEFFAGCREIAEEAKLTKEQISRFNRILLKAGWLEMIRKGNAFMPTLWRIAGRSHQ
jgi:DNA-binding winged helix-turn-helix (wHTH) protein